MKDQDQIKITEGIAAVLRFSADHIQFCRGTLARDEDGYAVAVSSPEASQFCAHGAIQRAIFEQIKLGELDPALEGEVRKASLEALANNIIDEESIDGEGGTGPVPGPAIASAIEAWNDAEPDPRPIFKAAAAEASRQLEILHEKGRRTQLEILLNAEKSAQ